MSEVEAEQFNRMIKQHTEMYDMLKDLKMVIKGDDWGRTGILGEIKEIKFEIKEHDKRDDSRFDQLFEFQKTQKMVGGWAGVAIKGMWAVALIAIGYFIDKLFT